LRRQAVEGLRRRDRGEPLPHPGRSGKDQARRKRSARDRLGKERNQPPVTDDISKGHLRRSRILTCYGAPAALSTSPVVFLGRVPRVFVVFADAEQPRPESAFFLRLLYPGRDRDRGTRSGGWG